MQGATLEEVTAATNAALVANREANRQEINKLFDDINELTTQITNLENTTITATGFIGQKQTEIRNAQLENLRAQLAAAEAAAESFNQKNIEINNKINASENELEEDRQKRFDERRKRREKELEARRKQEEKLASELAKIQEKIFKEELRLRLEVFRMHRSKKSRLESRQQTNKRKMYVSYLVGKRRS